MINTTISRVVENEANRRAAAARKAAEERLKSLDSVCPRIAQLQREIRDTAIDFSRKIMDSPADADALNALANDIVADKRGQIARELADHGLPADYLETQYVCPVCRDTGYTKGGVCACMSQAVINASFSECGVNPNENFDNFRFDLLKDAKQQRAMRKIHDYCLNYAENFPDNELRDILLIGVPGVGKTYLLNCIGGRVLANGGSVLKLTAYNLIGRILDTLHDDPSERPDFAMPELLIIDDLGAEPMVMNVTVECLLSIICERQDKGLATLIATNLDTDELTERYGSRIVSRLLSPRTVKIIPIETANVRLVK